MKELSIFIDESGDFGEYDYHSPYYIIAIVMHSQNIDISNDLSHLENELTQLGFPRHCVHAGPIIRQEAEYRLFQVADLVCTLKLIELKMSAHQLSKSEKKFFIDERTLKKNYLKPLATKQLKP